MYTVGDGKKFSAAVILHQKTLIHSGMKTIFLCNSNLRDIEFDVMCTPNGASVDNDSADTITMEELEEQFDSCRLGIVLDSIAHIEK